MPALRVHDIVEGFTTLCERWTLLQPTSIKIKIYSILTRSCQVWGCLLHALSVVVATSIFTETHVFHVGLRGHYRQLFGMFGRSTCEKVTNPSMLLLLGLGWYHTAHRVALLQWTTKVLFGGSYRDKNMRDQHQNKVKWVCILISSETRVEWQSRDKEPMNSEEVRGEGVHCHMPSPCPPWKLKRKQKFVLLSFILAEPSWCSTWVTHVFIMTLLLVPQSRFGCYYLGT